MMRETNLCDSSNKIAGLTEGAGITSGMKLLFNYSDLQTIASKIP
jgi:hypothetical protein